MIRMNRFALLVKKIKTLSSATHRLQHRSKSVSSSAVNQVKLNHIPSLPIFGSFLGSISGINIDQTKIMEIWPQCRQKYGDFYTIGLPGRGSDIYGTVYIVQDPKEMMKVLRVEGKYPTSSVQDLWSFQQMHLDYDYGRPKEILGHGEDWRLIRNFLQSDLLAPQSANRYLPGILETVPYISKGMPRYASDLNNFLQMASFDMFCSVLLGIYPRITDPDAVVDPADKEFCTNVAKMISGGARITMFPGETILYKLGIKSKSYKELYKSFVLAQEYGMNKIAELEKKKELGTLTQSEESSYWNQALDRWKLGDTDLTKEEVNRICLILFNASVDTTSGKTAWHLLHLGLNEEAQEKLYQEVYQHTQKADGKITPEYFAASNSPYLAAVLRESNRLSCPTNTTPMRRIDREVEIHGHILPVGSVVGFDQIGKSRDPEFVEDPLSFRPERFLPDAMEKRKGTKSEFLDHPLYSGPFGQGARRCPGSRVARNESMALLAQCVLDWKMNIPGVSSFRDVPQAINTVVDPVLPTFSFQSRIH